ncbi:hypothetical protein IT398_01205 [Candidatus Nomurabacteria bacterium]|nr:hypothetical protein [Candidatus Nomurabacteria bacterium]
MATAIKSDGRASQDFLPIKEIRDGVVILKNDSLRVVLMVSSINFALKGEDEQTAILLQFQNFLNSLDFHVQLFVESRRLDIKPYIRTLEERLVSQSNDLLKIQTREYIDFIRKFTESTDIMSKSFFVVIPYSPPVNLGQSGGSFLARIPGFGGGPKPAHHELNEFEEHRTQLEQRAAVVEQGFGRIGLRVVQLGTEELVELYFKIFNPGESDIPSIN